MKGTAECAKTPCDRRMANTSDPLKIFLCDGRRPSDLGNSLQLGQQRGVIVIGQEIYFDPGHRGLGIQSSPARYSYICDYKAKGKARPLRRAAGPILIHLPFRCWGGWRRQPIISLHANSQSTKVRQGATRFVKRAGFDFSASVRTSIQPVNNYA